jgi:hypothetical protein
MLSKSGRGDSNPLRPAFKSSQLFFYGLIAALVLAALALVMLAALALVVLTLALVMLAALALVVLAFALIVLTALGLFLRVGLRIRMHNYFSLIISMLLC